MERNEAHHLIDKIRCSEHILVVVGAGLSRPSGIPTFRDDPWFWERPVEDSASEAAFKRDPLYVWATYERLRLIALKASPNPAHTALSRLARAKPKLLTVSQNIDGT
jgi:NAD-dependent SIR2 family protein deacetylase